MPVFIDLLSILLGGSGFTRIQKAVVDQMGSSPPNSDHVLFFFGASLALGSALELLLGPVTEMVIAGFHIKSTFCHKSEYDGEMVHCCVECVEKTKFQNDFFFNFWSVHEAYTY